MIRALRLLLALWVLVILQTTLVPRIALGPARPDLPFLLVVLVALHEGAAAGAIAGFFAGLFVDLESARSLGTASLAGALVAFGVGTISGRLVRESAPTRMIVAFVAVLVKMQLVAVVADPGVAAGWSAFVRDALPGAVYTALLAPPLMAGLEWITGWEKETGRARR